MRQSDMELLLARDEQEVRSYFLCGSSARTNNIDGTTMLVTNKRIVLEFMNHNEVSRREIPIDHILFFRSHYYEEHEDSSFALRCKRNATTLFFLAALFIAAGVLGFLNIFNFAFLESMPILGLIPAALAIPFIAIAIKQIIKAKQFTPRVGKKLQLLIGTTLDFEQGIGFSTDSTKSLRDNMRTYKGTAYNSLVGSVELNPTREAKKMVNEIGALLIDIKTGKYDVDEEKLRRERAEKEAARREREAKEAAKREREDKFDEEEIEPLPQRPKKEISILKKDKNVNVKKEKYPEVRIQVDKKDKMAKYGAPLEEDEYSDLPSAQQAAFRKSKMPPPKKATKKSEDELLEEEYLEVIKSLNLG